MFVTCASYSFLQRWWIFFIMKIYYYIPVLKCNLHFQSYNNIFLDPKIKMSIINFPSVKLKIDELILEIKRVPPFREA